MAYKCKFQVTNFDKYHGDPMKPIICRSTWERAFCDWIEKCPTVVLWGFECLKIRYYSPMDDRWRTYYPDFVMKVKKPDGKLVTYVVEIKPKRQTEPPKKGKRKTKKMLQENYIWSVNQAKWRAAKDFCEDNGLVFQILTEVSLKEIGIKLVI